VRPKRVAFRTRNGVGTRGLAFAAQWLAYALPYRRFVAVLADADARLGADVDRYSFIVVDLHHLLLAGLPAHFESSMARQAVGSLQANKSNVASIPLSAGWSWLAESFGRFRFSCVRKSMLGLSNRLHE
jgi:hypothetical protein